MIVIAMVLAYVLGSLPVGYWLIRKAGYHPREVSAHNLGIENVFYRLGSRAAILSGLADIFKGVLALYLAPLLGIDNIGSGLWLALGVYVGHVFPPKQWFSDAPPRGRGNILLLGILAGLQGALGLPWWVVYPPVAVFAAILFSTRYTVLATVVAQAVLVLLLSVLDVSGMTKIMLWVWLGVVVWRFKENLGRIADGAELKLGEKVLVRDKDPNERVAAFMIHALTPEDYFQTQRVAWLKTLVDKGLIPLKFIQWVCWQLRPMKVGEIKGIYTQDGKHVRMHLITIPLLPEDFRDKPELATRRAIEGAKLAHELGASIFGLGAFWSTVGDKGKQVQDAVPEIHITNGGAYTAGTVKNAIPGILQHFAETGRDLKQATVGIVGANGVVAFGIARTISSQVKHVILLGRDMERLEKSKKALEKANPNTTFAATTDYAPLKDCQLIFSATSDPDPVIFPEHISEGTWIFDEGRPADVDDSVKNIAGVRVIPGGVVRPPGDMQCNIDLHFGEGAVPACLAETLIIAATGEYERKSLGQQTLTENINFFVQKAKDLGFTTVDH